MKTILTVPALILALGAPAMAQQVAPGTAGAMAHFNQDRTGNEIRVLPSTSDQQVTLSTRAGVKGDVIAHFNQSKSGNEVLRTDSVTVYSGQPSFGADIFEAIRAADD